MAEETQFFFNNENGNPDETQMTPPPLPAEAHEQQSEDAARPSDKPAEKDKKGVWRQVAVGAAAGAGIGVGAIALTSFTTAGNTNGNVSDDQLDSMIDSDMDVAMGVNDDMSFSQAFAAARAEVGPGGCFKWHGGIYGTYTAEEWNSMSAAERAEFENHFSWGAGGASSTAHHSTQSHHTSHSSGHTAHADNQQAQTPGEAPANRGSDYVSRDNPGGQGGQQGGGGQTTQVTHEEGGLRVLQVGYDPDLNANVAIVEDKEGMKMAFIDTDNDKVFDIAIADFNQNGHLDDNEKIDISGKNLTVQMFEEMAANQGGVSNTMARSMDDVNGNEHILYGEEASEEVDDDNTLHAEAEPGSADEFDAEVTVESTVEPEAMTVGVDAADADVTVADASPEPAFDDSATDFSVDDTAIADDPSVSDVDMM